MCIVYNVILCVHKVYSVYNISSPCRIQDERRGRQSNKSGDAPLVMGEEERDSLLPGVCTLTSSSRLCDQ